MKRFYCTVCKKVKRVRKYPVLIDNTVAVDPSLRVGACNRHSDNQVHRATVSRKVAR
jgi:hypothetical protein